MTVTPVGSATFAFSDRDNGTFTYTVNGVTQTKPITRQVFATPVGVCTLGGEAGAAANFQDLWWRSPAGSESGWGVNITQQGGILFTTWFTYGADEVVVTAVGTATFAFSGPNDGTFSYTVDGVSGSKPITRQVFATPASTCR